MQSNAQQKSPAVTMDEIETLVRSDLPALPDMPPHAAAGDFAETYRWLARAQHKDEPAIRHPRIALFTATGMPAEVETIGALAQEANSDLKVYELNADKPEFDAHMAAHAVAYGMMAVQPGVDLVAVTALSPPPENPTLQNCGSPDIAAALGCMIAARLARIPVLTEGPGASAAVAILKSLHADAADHCRDADVILPRQAAVAAGSKSALLIPFLKALVKV